MTDECLFCRIVEGTIPAEIVYSDAAAVAFPDINPQAPTHVLVVPRKHVGNIGELGADPAAAGAYLASIRGLVDAMGLDSYRTVFNTGADAHQTVMHVHAHVLAGRAMQWPPG